MRVRLKSKSCIFSILKSLAEGCSYQQRPQGVGAVFLHTNQRYAISKTLTPD